MASRSLSSLDPAMFPLAMRFVAECAAAGLEVLIYCTYRSIEEQDKLYAQGRTEPGPIVTNARGGESAHNFGLALDGVPTVGGKPAWDAPIDGELWQKYGKCAREAGLEWGGDWPKFKDAPHCQYPNWKEHVHG